MSITCWSVTPYSAHRSRTSRELTVRLPFSRWLIFGWETMSRSATSVLFSPPAVPSRRSSAPRRRLLTVGLLFAATSGVPPAPSHRSGPQVAMGQDLLIVCRAVVSRGSRNGICPCNLPHGRNRPAFHREGSKTGLRGYPPVQEWFVVPSSVRRRWYSPLVTTWRDRGDRPSSRSLHVISLHSESVCWMESRPGRSSLRMSLTSPRLRLGLPTQGMPGRSCAYRRGGMRPGSPAGQHLR